jgi:hypothetical protein
MSAFRIVGFICLAGVIIGMMCSKNTPVSGIEITNGNCVGKIFNRDGSAAKETVVKLIPIGYDPYSHTRESIDSTLTNENGIYGFTVSQSNYYNIVAEKGPTSCLRDSIFVQTDATTIVDNDTLRESGRLSGIVRLKPGDDSRKAVILVLGTNCYVIPSDTSGNFVTPLLPKGNYTIQIFTTMTGYAVFDTNVIVKEDSSTRLDVSLPSSNAPSIAKLSATYDSATMFVSLSWPMPDTSKIVSLALYRNSSTGNDTMVIVDKSATSYTDDVVSFDGDSISYKIAGIGINYREGYRTATKPIVVCGMIYCVKKIDLSRVGTGLPDIGYVDIFSDREDEIFLVGYKGIYKLDSNGIVKKDFMIDYSDSNRLAGYLQSDDFGHLYIYNDNYNHPTVIKFDRDLNVLAETELPLDPGGVRSIEVSGNGTIFTFSFAGDYADVKIIDSANAVLNDFHIMNRQIDAANRMGDTIITYEYSLDKTTTVHHPPIHFYDTAFTLLSVFEPVDFSGSAWGNPRFSKQISYGGEFIAAPNGIFVSVFRSSDPKGDFSLLIFTDPNGRFLARIVVPGSHGLSFDSLGNLYFVTYEYPDFYEMAINPMKTLFKYTMGPLLRKIRP